MLTLKHITPQHLEALWRIQYSAVEPEWKKWDAPYFEDFKWVDYETFRQQDHSFMLSNNVRGIFVNDQLIGMVSRYWECERTRWLEIGIVIFDPNYWQNGYGTQALRQWVSDTFNTYAEIEHVGLTTWSGNIRMMKVAERIGMRQEACIRKVRYHNGYYYDSVKYGVLREEWQMS